MDLQAVSKAIAGAIASALVAYLSQRGIVLNEEVTGAVAVLVAAGIGFAVTYIAPRNKEVR